MKIKVHLSIGDLGAKHEDELEISDCELSELETGKQRDDLINQALTEWAWGHIELWHEEIAE